MVLVLGSTLCLLQRGRGRRAPRWWAAYARLHVRRGLHALHERLRARGPVRVGAVGASGRAPAGARRDGGRGASASCRGSRACKGDLDSPTTDILSRAAAVHAGLRAVEPRPLGDRLPVRSSTGTARARPARRAGARRARARARPRRSRDSPPRRCAGACGVPTAALVLVIVLARLGAGRRGARQRGRLEPLRDAQPGGVVARVRALPRRAAGRRRAAARHRRGRAGDRRVRGRRRSRCSTATSGGRDYDAAIAFDRPQRGPGRRRRRRRRASTPAGVPTALDRRRSRGRRARLPARARRGPLRPVPDPRRRRRRRRTWSSAPRPPRAAGGWSCSSWPGGPPAREALAARAPRVPARRDAHATPASTGSRSSVLERSDRERRVVGRERRRRRRTSSRSRSAASASTGPTRSGAGTARRRTARRRARRSAARSARRPRPPRPCRARELDVEHHVVVDHDLVEPARDDVEAGRHVAAAREREPEVQRPHVAHEGAVLVPGAADRRLGLAQRRLVHRQQRRLAEVVADEPGQPGGREQLEHLERQPAASRRRARRRRRGSTAARRRPRSASRADRTPRSSRARTASRPRTPPAPRRRDRSAPRAPAPPSRSTRPRTSTQPSRRIPARSSPGVSVGRRRSPGRPPPLGRPA